MLILIYSTTKWLIVGNRIENVSIFSAGSRSSTIEQPDPCHLMLSSCLETIPFFALILCFYEASMTDYSVLSLLTHPKRG